MKVIIMIFYVAIVDTHFLAYQFRKHDICVRNFFQYLLETRWLVVGFVVGIHVIALIGAMTLKHQVTPINLVCCMRINKGIKNP